MIMIVVIIFFFIQSTSSKGIQPTYCTWRREYSTTGSASCSFHASGRAVVSVPDDVGNNISDVDSDSTNLQ